MLTFSSAVSIYYCPAPVNLHRSFDGLPGLVRQLLGHDPLDGSLYAFFNRRLTSVKILCWEGDGYSIWCKRLERGRFNIPRGTDGRLRLEPRELQGILAGIKPRRYYRRHQSEL